MPTTTHQDNCLFSCVNSWKNMPICQHPAYDDLRSLKLVQNRLSNAKALVSPSEINKLKQDLRDVKKNNGFILQAGECAESFESFCESYVKNILNVIDEMSKILHPSVKIARLAGQFAKPRSEEFEQIGNDLVPSYRGDIINSIDPNNRNPRASRMIVAYKQSKKTLEIMKQANDKVYSSHEALLLYYEESLLCFDNNLVYDTSAHMLWLGERTRKLDHAHVEFLKNIQNPIGIKISHKSSAHEILELCRVLNPENELGKIILINRMGVKNINEFYPRILSDLASAKSPNDKAAFESLLFICDPMHGNTKKLSCGRKTRFFDDIKSEVESFFDIHNKLKIQAHGLHIEVSGSSVTECMGFGVSSLNIYETKCDPRLNPEQSLEIAQITKRSAKRNIMI